MFEKALRVAADDDTALLGFVRRWGVPGVGTGEARGEGRFSMQPQSRSSDDTVWAVRRLIREVQRHFAWLRALQSHETRSPALPGLWENHEACLEAGGQTVAVQGRGLAGVYPAANKALAKRIPSQGALILPEFGSAWPDLALRFRLAPGMIIR